MPIKTSGIEKFVSYKTASEIMDLYFVGEISAEKLARRFSVPVQVIIDHANNEENRYIEREGDELDWKLDQIDPDLDHLFGK